MGTEQSHSLIARTRPYLLGALVALVLYGVVVTTIWAVARAQDDRRVALEAKPGAPVFTAADVSAKELDVMRDAKAADAGKGGKKNVLSGPPRAVELASADLSAQVSSLAKTDPHELPVPEDPAVAAWYEWTARPGETGASVIVGHVDSDSGPGAFYRLARAEAGDRIKVEYAKGVTATFIVTKGEWHLKTKFPADRVFKDTKESALRLITCGGEFDSSTGHYLYNYILFARLASIQK